MSQLKLMISHASEDRGIAEAWQKLLGGLFEETQEVWFSDDPAGAFRGTKPFAIQIQDKIENATAVLTIQTAYSVHKPWVVWEAGMTRGMKKDIYVVTYGFEDGQLKNPLDGDNQYDGEKKADVKKVISQISKQAGAEAPTEAAMDQAWVPYCAKIKETQQALPIISAAQYDKQIILRVLAQTAVTQEDPEAPLQEIKVLNVGGGLSIFRKNSGSKSISWADFRELLTKQDAERSWPGSAVAWVEALEGLVLPALRGKMKDTDAESLPLYYDEAHGIAYRPSISSKRQSGEYVDIIITFNQLPSEITKRPAGKAGVLSHLLDTCRMYRCGVLEREDFKLLFRGELSRSRREDVADEFQRAITNIRTEVQNRGIRQDDVIDAFPAELQEQVSKILEDYGKAIHSIDPKLKPTEEQMRAGFATLQRHNKAFYLATHAAYGRYLEKLEGNE